MKEHFVCKSIELNEGERQIVRFEDQEIGIFKHEGELYAYSNYCLHQGGPACEGLIIGRVEEPLDEDKRSLGLYFSETETSFACPWHGYEYDIKTGEHVADRRMRLRKYRITEREGEVYVEV